MPLLHHAIRARFRPSLATTSKRLTPIRKSIAFTFVATLCIACGPSGPSADGGASPFCGDNVKDPDELCDDGNRLPSDGCSPECMPSGTLYDCVDLLVSDTDGDWSDVRDLLPLADGTFVAGGSNHVGGTHRGWLARYEPDGTQLWFVDAASVDADVESTVNLAGDGQLGTWALAFESGTNYELAHYDSDGAVTSTATVASEAGLAVSVHAAEHTPNGVWLAGELEGDAWVAIYDPALGSVTDILLEDHLGHRDSVYAMARNESQVAIAATVSTSPNFDVDVPLLASTDILVIQFDLEGNEIQRTLLGPGPDSALVRTANRISSDDAGLWFVAGSSTPRSVIAAHQVWLAPVQPASAWDWTTEATKSIWWGDMVGVEDGVIVGTNQTGIDDSSAPTLDGWLGDVASGGDMRWELGSATEDVEDDRHYTHRVLARDSEGRVRTAGTIAASGSEGPSTVRSCLVAR